MRGIVHEMLSTREKERMVTAIASGLLCTRCERPAICLSRDRGLPHGGCNEMGTICPCPQLAQ
jgi:hypothetical protein